MGVQRCSLGIELGRRGGAVTGILSNFTAVEARGCVAMPMCQCDAMRKLGICVTMLPIAERAVLHSGVAVCMSSKGSAVCMIDTTLNLTYPCFSYF